MIDSNSIVERTPGLLAANVGTEMVMLSIASNAYYDVDSIGAEIWRRLEAPRRVRDLVASLVGDYDVALDVCEGDVIEFLEEALSEGLIRTVAGPAQS